MKNTAKLTLLLAATLCLAACEKNNESVAMRERDITYTVAGGTQATNQRDGEAQSTTVHLTTVAEWEALLERFCNWAEEGSTVTFYGTQAPLPAKGGQSQAGSLRTTKDATTFSTTDREAMKQWMAEMEDAGMTVTVTYDKETGTWHGMAYATAPQPPMPSGELITYEYDGMNDFGYIWSFDTANHRVYITLHDKLQYITAPDYPVGVYEYRHADEVNTLFAYWLINSWGDTAGLYTLESIGSDTLHFNSTHIGNPVTLVRTDRWHTYICSNWELNIVMHVGGNVIEVYPEVYAGQMGVNGLELTDVIWPFGFGRFEMWRTEMTQPAIGPTYWGLTLDFRPFGGTDTLGGFFIQGIPFVNNQFTISKENGSQFFFQRL